MTPAAFNALPTEAQIKLALRHNTLIGHRGAGAKNMHLYAVENFYVEVVFTKRSKYVHQVHASTDDGILEPYLKQIDLTVLQDLL